jgi:quercetin dioxygenase-like cupin family protein
MWNDIPIEQMNPLLTRQVRHCDTMTVARVSLRKSCVVPEHSHHNEQVSLIQSGRMKFVVGGVEHLVGPGESVLMPPHVPHWVEALEDSVIVDVFVPRREDWIRGDDAYLRK